MHIYFYNAKKAVINMNKCCLKVQAKKLWKILRNVLGIVVCKLVSQAKSFLFSVEWNFPRYFDFNSKNIDSHHYVIPCFHEIYPNLQNIVVRAPLYRRYNNKTSKWRGGALTSSSRWLLSTLMDACLLNDRGTTTNFSNRTSWDGVLDFLLL